MVHIRRKGYFLKLRDLEFAQLLAMTAYKRLRKSSKNQFVMYDFIFRHDCNDIVNLFCAREYVLIFLHWLYR